MSRTFTGASSGSFGYARTIVTDNEIILVLCVAPDEATAHSLASGLVEARLAACVNVISGVRSSYWWQGKVETSDEVKLFIKTRRGNYGGVEAWIHEHHPYDVPEVLALPAVEASEPYARWLLEYTARSES